MSLRYIWKKFINNNTNNKKNILNFYKKYMFLKPLRRTWLLHFTIMFYHDSLNCIISRCLREVWLFHPNSMFYCIIFFVKRNYIFSFFPEMHISHIFVNNLNTSPQARICHFPYVSVRLCYFDLMSFTVLQCFLWIPLLFVTIMQRG